jgi:LuxR family maltose regulon positive regulatory protein
MSKTATARRVRSRRAPGWAAHLEGLARLSGATETPEPRPGYISRPQLVGTLIRATAPVTLIAAPAGYGKTTLATEWDGWDARPFAWVTLGAEHDTRTTGFVSAIEQALDDVAPVPAGKRGASTRSRSGAAAVALARLVRSLASRPPFVLVLDDLHQLDSSESLETVRTLARHVPDGSVVAICSRTDPPLPIGRLRANRELTEIRARDLAMTAQESAMLLEMSGLKLTAAHAEALARKTEGWAAGLYLAALALRGQQDMHAAVGGFGGDDAIVAEYLRDEVLSQLPPEQVAFLTRASLLETLSGPACDGVLGRSDSAAQLSSICHAGLLLVPVGRSQESFRCHGLLAGMLKAELRRTNPEEEARLHRRASDFYGERADVDRAMHHAVAAGDTDRAARLLASAAPEYVTHGRNGTMEHWLDSFTSVEIAGHPALSLAAANSQLLKGDLAAVQRWESATRRILHETPPSERSSELEASVALLHGVVGRQVVRMGTDAARAFRLLPEDSPWRPLCCLVEGVSHHLCGDRDTAEARLLDGVRRGTVAAPNIQTLCLAQLALVSAGRDDWESAAGFSSRALAQVAHYGLQSYPTSALVFAASAMIRARRGRVEEAQGDAREARRLLAMLTDFVPWYEMETRLALASASVRLSDTLGARELIASIEPFARRMPEAQVLHEWMARTLARADAASAGPALLTTAELRILGFLPTHLSFREIADRLYVSANTVKTQAHAVYRKLDAASRSEAVARATQLGLLDF